MPNCEERQLEIQRGISIQSYLDPKQRAALQWDYEWANLYRNGRNSEQGETSESGLAVYEFQYLAAQSNKASGELKQGGPGKGR